MNEKSIKNNLTILLTLKNREDFTFRWLDYLNKRNCPFRIFIADGGSNDSVRKHLEKEKYLNLNLFYKKYDEDLDFQTFYRKVASALDLIKSPYYIMADNDDFYSIEGLIEAVKFLNSNDGYVACGGRVTPIKIKKGKLYDDRIKFYLSLCTNYSDPKPSERIKKFLHGSMGNYYSVVKTDVGRQVWKKICERKFKDIRMHEFMIDTYLLYTGKIHNLESPFYFRQVGVNIGNSAKLTNDFFDEIFSKSWALEIDYIAEQVVIGCGEAGYTHADFMSDLKVHLLPRFVNEMKSDYINTKARKNLIKKGFKGIKNLHLKEILNNVIFPRWGYFMKKKTTEMKHVIDFLSSKS